jgi:hypothetical protein
MSLFTVIVDFADRTQAIEQYQAQSPREALERFVREAEALSEHDRKQAMQLVGKGDERLIQVADRYGVWMWVPVVEHEMGDIYGGHVIQTDPQAPVRRRNG